MVKWGVTAAVAIAVLVLTVVASISLLLLGGPADRISQVTLPPGFAIDYYALDVPGARSMTLGDDGTLFVGTRGEGNVYALPDRNGDGKADAVITIAEGLFLPNGVAFQNGSLYVAEVDRVIRFDGIESRLDDPPEPVVVSDAFPDEAMHGWKFIAFGPDGRLYVPVGAPCNVCEPPGPLFSRILRMNADGSNLSVFAEGVRNTVGFDWDPETRVLWFTDNGRDWLGENLPPDELNRAPETGMDFGFPYCHGANISDPEFGDLRSCDEFTPPVQELGPHVAALGMRFYTGSMFPEEYDNLIFIAEHGSWNRAVPIGYRVTLVRLEDSRPISYEVFAEGWLQGDSAWGRPVDIEVAADGALFVSDDLAGAIYRISYEESI
jgi:glucose/arabinose dehydrogenase